MENTQNNSAKFAFYYMLSLVALVFMSLSTGMIIFQIINKSIADVLNQYSASFSSDQLKFAISALIISAPIFYFLTRAIHKNLFSGALNKDSGIRRWLTYLVLFAASCVMIGWLIDTLNTFFNGDLTSKFILKALTAIAISAAVFTFYFYDIRREIVVGKKDRMISLYFYASLAVVVAAFIASLFFVESPTETRNRKLDESVLSSFDQIDSAINTYFIDKGTLPANLDALKTEVTYLMDTNFVDPATMQKHDYKVLEKTKYELCATFRTSNLPDSNASTPIYQGVRWQHATGYQCLWQKVIDNTQGKGIEPINMVK